MRLMAAVLQMRSCRKGEQMGDKQKMRCRVCGNAITATADETLMAHADCYSETALYVDELHYGKHGAFVTNLLLAWTVADPSNKALLEPVMRAVAAKYKWPSETLKGAIANMRETK